MVRRLELSEADHETLIAHAEQGHRFLSTPFDMPSLRMLTHRFRSGDDKDSVREITNAPFLLAIARTGRRVILSTGMSTLDEVKMALGVGFRLPRHGRRFQTGRTGVCSGLCD